MERVLEGVRVLDLTQAYSGPFCTMHLADHGAEVIKIEQVGVGDQSRTWAPFQNGYSAYYSYINRGKKGMTLDLKAPEGKELFLELVQKADVVCENYRVGTMERLGLGYEELRKVNPRIIYGSISGFGVDGPLASRPCYDIVAQAMSGMMSVTGHPDGPCVKAGPSIGDNYAGTYLSLGICMALYQRERTGEGQRLDVAMLDTLFSVLENFVVNYTVKGEISQRQGNIDPGIAPFDSFTAKDGEFVMGCGTNKFFATLCGLMGREELVDDPRFQDNGKRCANYLPDLKEIVNQWTRTLSLDELEARLVGAGIPFGRIQDIGEACRMEQIRTRNMLWSFYDPGIGGGITVPGCPIKMHGKPDTPQKPAPTLGQDSVEILEQLVGLSKKRIVELQQQGIV